MKLIKFHFLLLIFFVFTIYECTNNKKDEIYSQNIYSAIIDSISNAHDIRISKIYLNDSIPRTFENINPELPDTTIHNGYKNSFTLLELSTVRDYMKKNLAEKQDHTNLQRYLKKRYQDTEIIIGTVWQDTLKFDTTRLIELFFTKIGFNNQKTQAFLWCTIIENYPGSRSRLQEYCGEGGYYFLQKKSGKWEIKDIKRLMYIN